jgi:secondary thiamine-phosphate synthase enzyme
MKSFRKVIWMEVPTRRAFINITPQVKECVRESGVSEGLVLINSMHTTAAVFVDDDEKGLYHHYEVWLEKLAPVVAADQYDDDAIGEDIVDAHLKRQLLGRGVTVAVTGGQLDFGDWENVFYGEFDGGRRKRVLVKIIGE